MTAPVTGEATLSVYTRFRNIAKGRRAVLTVVGLAVSLTAALMLGPAAANGAVTIDQMSAQGDIAAGSLACVGPFTAGAKDIVAGGGSSFQTDASGATVAVAVDWQLRRGDVKTEFFADADIVQTLNSDFFSTSVQPGSKFLPGNFWVCVSSGASTTNAPIPVHYKMSVGNGIPA
jgi:hypothetical protein